MWGLGEDQADGGVGLTTTRGGGVGGVDNHCRICGCGRGNGNGDPS